MKTPADDPTPSLLETVPEDSLAGLANYHLMTMELDNIRILPERSDRERNVRPG
jgi:hypothetical protein